MNVTEITEEIMKLQDAETNWTNIQRLAWLYTVSDHMTGAAIAASPAERMPVYTGEFGEVVSGKDISAVMNVLTEHMAVVKVLYPKEYEAVLDRIREVP